MNQNHRNTWAIVGQVIAALITTAAAVCSVVLAILIVESRLGPGDPASCHLSPGGRAPRA